MSKITIELKYLEYLDTLCALRYFPNRIDWDFEKRFDDAFDAWKKEQELNSQEAKSLQKKSTKLTC